MMLIFTNAELLALRGLPPETKVVKAGATTGSERGSVDGVFIEVEDATETEIE